MSNGYNQYIGMRYVPIVDGEWSQSKAYEPLVVVVYNGNSYISKTYVPAGTLPTNETYWILAANYNAQVEQYRQEVRQYQATVETFDDAITTAQGDIDALETSVATKMAIGDVLIERYNGASETIPANGAGTTVSVNVAKTGYSCEGVVGFFSGTSWCCPIRMEVISDTLYFNFRNFSSGESVITPYFDLLYIKNPV